MKRNPNIFGELRSLLASPEASWESILNLLLPYKNDPLLEHEVVPYLLEIFKGGDIFKERKNPKDLNILDLLESPICLLFTFLHLGGNRIGVEGARILALSPYLKNLTTLNLGLNGIGDEGVREIANSPYLKNLTTLDLWGNRIGVEGVREIAQSPYLKNLTTLDLECNGIESEGAREIAQSP